MKQNCMNCSSRTDKDECAVKMCFSQNFANKGHKYRKSVEIIFSDENDCIYWEESKSNQQGVTR
jgi:hypothetical protein